MKEARTMRDHARKDVIAKLMISQVDVGQAETGVIVEGMLEGIAVYLKGAIGAEAAFNVMQRHADDAAGDVIQNIARSQ